MILEPARAAALAPLIVEMHDLTDREREVAMLLMRGLPIPEIAGALWITQQTLRDHVKAIYAKLHVSSRAELMAKLFYERLPSA